MRGAVILSIILAVGTYGLPRDSFAVTITDTYIGAAPNHPDYVGKDRIGAENWFEVSKMEVSFSDGYLVVDIYSTYFDNIGKYGTELGDLFVSIDGWNPNPVGEGFEQDSFSDDGEDWEYAVVLDKHRPEQGELSGFASLYELHPEDASKYNDEIKLAQEAIGPGYIFRENQEVQYEGSGSPLSGVEGKWFIGGENSEYLRISLEMLPEWSGVHEFGFHYTMTCANDVIEGSARIPAPEPATMLLIGTALIGLVAFGRRKFSPKDSGL